MSYEVFITQAALRDMEAAANYIDRVLKNVQAAEALLNRAEDVLARLARLPERYAIEDDPVLAAWEIRHVPIENYLAFFIASEAERRVYVVRFLYFRRDWTSILKKGISLE